MTCPRSQSLPLGQALLPPLVLHYPAGLFKACVEPVEEGLLSWLHESGVLWPHLGPWLWGGPPPSTTPLTRACLLLPHLSQFHVEMTGVLGVSCALWGWGGTDLCQRGRLEGRACPAHFNAQGWPLAEQASFLLGLQAAGHREEAWQLQSEKLQSQEPSWSCAAGRKHAGDQGGKGGRQ